MAIRLAIEDVISYALEARLAELHVSMPCKVDSYDSEKNTVNLIPLLKRKRRSTKTGATSSSEIKALQNVPVAFMRTSKGWFTLPIAKGDVGMVVFSERSLKDWMSKTKGEVVEPVDEAKHPLDGAWFYPGCYPSKSPIDPTNSSHVVIATSGSSVELHLGEAGLGVNNFVALSKLVLDEMNKIRDALHSHSHQVVLGTCTAGGATGTATTIANPSIPALTEPKAERTKAK
ncbi:MAG: hypothetical protein IT381_28240 [Deltaproteobacteria bacterium]|nr:hypothetical protein [Deltaproteobacteria bacterium]